MRQLAKNDIQLCKFYHTNAYDSSVHVKILQYLQYYNSNVFAILMSVKMLAIIESQITGNSNRCTQGLIRPLHSDGNYTVRGNIGDLKMLPNPRKLCMLKL